MPMSPVLQQVTRLMCCFFPPYLVTDLRAGKAEADVRFPFSRFLCLFVRSIDWVDTYTHARSRQRSQAAQNSRSHLVREDDAIDFVLVLSLISLCCVL
jgi:hypothetical protein